MTPQEILSRPARVLSQADREKYFEDGFILLPAFLDKAWLERIHAVTEEFIDESRGYTTSDAKFDLQAGHSADAPMLRRLSFPVEHHELYRQLAFDSPIVDIAEDLLGANVRYHHSKLNFKWSGGGEEVKWHQDIQYWPHTDFSPLTIGIYLEDVDDEMGPMGVVPGSHLGELYDLLDAGGDWSGSILDDDLPRAHTEQAVYLKGPAGSVTVHNCCSVHGSAPNLSTRPRPLLLQTYAAGDSFPLQTIGTNGLGGYANTMVRGEPASKMVVEGRAFPVAPDWSGGYTSIFDVQRSAAQAE